MSTPDTPRLRRLLRQRANSRRAEYRRAAQPVDQFTDAEIEQLAQRIHEARDQLVFGHGQLKHAFRRFTAQ